jgi:hypothetical protein
MENRFFGGIIFGELFDLEVTGVFLCIYYLEVVGYFTL